jgi:hypothetical protein
MSRGFGSWQRYLWSMIRRHGKPMTFDDIRAAIDRASGAPKGARLRPSVERSMRRALHRMVSNGGMIAIGDGGRAEPFRYFIHPILIGMMGDTPEASALRAALEADPGANKAAAKAMVEMFPQAEG